MQHYYPTTPPHLYSAATKPNGSLSKQKFSPPRKTNLLTGILLLVSVLAKSQRVSGGISDSSGAPMAFVPVGLLHAKDSSVYKGIITSDSGSYRFNDVKTGRFLIKVAAPGYRTAYSSVFAADSLTTLSLPDIRLSSQGINLGEVAVTVFNPVIEFKKGIVVMNIENDLLAKGNTVLELLKRMPGIMVDAQNNISVNGVGGARFLIDDRLQQMPSQQVIEMLAGMSADAVSKLELIKNPPARYDASGTGGLINIVTKKAKIKGYSGNVMFACSQGQRFRYGPFVSFNYKADKISVFSNFSLGIWQGLNTIYTYRELTPGTYTETINSLGLVESRQQVFSGNGGIEYELHPKTLLGLYVNGNHNNEVYDNKTRTDISNSPVFNYDKLLFDTRHTLRFSTPSINLSLQHKLDSAGGQIRISSAYTNFLDAQDKRSRNRFYDLNDFEVAPVSIYNTNGSRDYKIWTQKLDLNKTFKNKLSLEAGLKSDAVNNYNEAELYYSNRATGIFTGDSTFYIIYRYKERISAAYATLARNWERIGLSIGLRAEDTDIHAQNPITGYQLKRHYFNLFPSGSLDLRLNKKNTLTMAYSYRIDRPSYDMLNPIRIVNEQLNYTVGNSELKPQYTHYITLDHNYNQWLTQSIGYHKTKDFTFYYSYTPDFSRAYIDTIFNFPDRNNYEYSLSVHARVKWYSFQSYGVVMYRNMQGQLNGQDVSSQTTSFYVNLNQEFFLPKNFKLQIWSGYGTGFNDGPQYYYPRSAVHASINKTFFDKKLSITLSVHDVFYRDYGAYTNTLTGQYWYYNDKFDSRRVRININYRFGKMNVEQRMKTEGNDRLRTGK